MFDLLLILSLVLGGSAVTVDVSPMYGAALSGFASLCLSPDGLTTEYPEVGGSLGLVPWDNNFIDTYVAPIEFVSLVTLAGLSGDT